MASLSTVVFHVIAAALFISSIQCINPPSNFSWPKNSKNLCFIATFNLTLNIRYMKSDKTNATVQLDMNSTTYETYSVSCSDPTDVHQLTVTMLNGFTVIMFDFALNATNRTVLNKVEGYVTFNKNQAMFPDYDTSLEGVHSFSADQSLFSTDQGMSYRCFAQTDIVGFPESNSFSVVSISLENTRIQSFVDDSIPFSDYGLETVCPTDDEKDSNIVPIVVGAALGAMIIIVLVAYIIGRRRNRSGYSAV